MVYTIMFFCVLYIIILMCFGYILFFFVLIITTLLRINFTNQSLQLTESRERSFMDHINNCPVWDLNPTHSSRRGDHLYGYVNRVINLLC